MPAEQNEREFLRFTRLNRILHIIMIVSFISLALTGMTLKFSYTGWASTLSRLFGGYESAGYIHRLAAVFMFGIFVAHVTDLVRLRKREGLSWRGLLFGPGSMLFNRKDLADLVGNIKWFLGKGPRPNYGRWTYWEKFDYFAVFWGIFVIGSTGLTLWFPQIFTLFLPGWFLNVATIVHSDEALLAVGFIFTGRMPVEEFRRDKPEEYEALVKAGTLDEHLVEAYPPIVLRAVRAFGWTALTAGFAIVVGIIYAMVFAYR
jgi:cytochrome b subunit of formate dehydrogenase